MTVTCLILTQPKANRINRIFVIEFLFLILGVKQSKKFKCGFLFEHFFEVIVENGSLEISGNLSKFQDVNLGALIVIGKYTIIINKNKN